MDIFGEIVQTKKEEERVAKADKLDGKDLERVAVGIKEGEKVKGPCMAHVGIAEERIMLRNVQKVEGLVKRAR